MRKADFLSISQSFCSFICFFLCFIRAILVALAGLPHEVFIQEWSGMYYLALLRSWTWVFWCQFHHHFFMRDYYLIEHESASIFQMTKQQVFVVKNLTIFPSSLPECHPQRGSPSMPQFHPRQVKWNCAKPKRPWGTKNAHRRSIKRPLLVVRFVSLVVDGVISHFKWLCRLNRET